MPGFTLTDSGDIFPQAGVDTSGHDTIDGRGGGDQIAGGAGNDYINGGTGEDILSGGTGSDTLEAGLLPGEDRLDGGTGIDTGIVHYENVKNVATNVSVRVVATASAGTWSILVDGITGPTLTGIERFQISSGNSDDRLTGAGGSDTLTSLGGNDAIYGGGGDDSIAKRHGRYDLRGGDGTDTLTVQNTQSANTSVRLIFDARSAVGTISAGSVTTGSFREFERFRVFATERNDEVFLGALSDVAYGGGGRDELHGYGGNDELDGAAGADSLYGGSGNDALYAGGGLASGAFEADQLYGGSGNDLINLGTALEGGARRTYAGVRIDGGSGTDLLEVEGLTTVLDFSAAEITGIEEIEFSTGFTGGIVLTAAQFNGIGSYSTPGFVQVSTAGDLVANGDWFMARLILFDGGQTLDLTGARRPFNDFSTNVVGGAGADKVIGGALRDRVSGAGGVDLLYGRDANDQLEGGADKDQLFGGGGNDRLFGGGGADRLTGGTGSDDFIWFFGGDSGPALADRDVITDFTLNPAAGAGFVDRLDFSFIDAQPATAGSQSFSFIGTAAYSGEGQIRAIQSGDDTLVTVNIAGASGSELIVTLQGVQASLLTAADFVL